MSAQQIEQAVLALHNPQNRYEHEQAKHFLLEFDESEAAWQLSLELLSTSASLLVQFYAANCIYTKIVRGLMQSTDEGKIASVSATLLQFLRRSTDVAQPSDQRTVAARVCLALAALSVKMRNGIPQLVQEVFGTFFGGSMETLSTANAGVVILGLLIVKSLPEEVEKVDMSRQRRDELQGQLREVAPNIIQLVDFVACNRSDLSAEALHALECWLTVGGMTITSLSRDAPGLFDGLCRLVARPASASVDMLVAACGVLTRLATMSEYPRPSGRDAAVTKVMEAILTGLPAAMEVLSGPDDEPMHAYCSMVIEVAKSEVIMLASGNGPAMGMIEMLLALTRHPNLHVATISMEFWEAFREVPMAKRAPALGSPLCMRMLEVLADRLSFPSNFTSWDKEVAIDEEDFARFRENDLARDMLESCYMAMRVHFFLHLGQRMDTARDVWQVSEVALLMMQQVARVTSDYLEHGNLRTAADPAASEDQAQTSRFLLQMVHRFTESPGMYAHPLVLRSLVRFLGSYRPLLSLRTGPNARLRTLMSEDQSVILHRLVLRCLHAGLALPDAGEVTSLALKGVCVCPGGLAVVKRDRECLELLMRSFEQASIHRLDIQHQMTVVEAIVRVVIDTEQARAGLNHFTAPILNGLGGALAAPGDGQQREVVKVALQLLGQTVRFLDAGSGTQNGHHVAQDLVESLWPLLDRVSVLYRQDEEVLEQLFIVYQNVVVGLRPLVAPRLDQLLVIISQLYAATAHEGAVNVIAAVVEIFTGEADNDAFAALLQTVCGHTWEYVQAGHAPSEIPGLVTAFFDMIMRYLSFRSAVLYGSNQLGLVLDFALECLGAMERESTRSVLRWVREVFRHIETNPTEPMLVQPIRLLEERGQRLISVTMAALAGRAPSTLWPNYFELFHGMILAWDTLTRAAGGGSGGNNCPNPCLVWIRHAACDGNVIGEALPAQSREMVVGLILKQAMEGKQKLKIFMDDLARICKSEQDLEALASYQI